MKGRGKSAHYGSIQEQENEEYRLTFPNLAIVDHEKDCKLFTAVLQRPANGTVTAEELDQVQTDLELLLTSAGRRLKLLESEIHTLMIWQDKKCCNVPVAVKSKVTMSPGKRGKSAVFLDECACKKFKDINGSMVPSPVPSPVARTSSCLGKAKASDGDTLNSTSSLPRVVKNECVDKFWQAVEAFVHPVEDEDIIFLKNEIQKVSEEESEYFNIPQLGQHYKDVWPEEDLLGEMEDESRMVQQVNKLSTSAVASEKSIHLLPVRKTDNESDLKHNPFGPLTQRLVSALIEENLATPLATATVDGEETVEEASSLSPQEIARQLNISNTLSLEQLIKRELEDQGILNKETDSDGALPDDSDDEILSKLKESQDLLRPLLHWKRRHLCDLLTLAKEQQLRQQLWIMFDECDVKLHEEYRKLNLARQKNKPSLKKEKENMRKVLKEFNSLYMALEGSYDNSLAAQSISGDETP